jgi:hypothetical protein
LLLLLVALSVTSVLQFLSLQGGIKMFVVEIILGMLGLLLVGGFVPFVLFCMGEG